MLRSLASIAVVTATVLAPTTAFAAEPPPPDPRLAAGLSAGTPLVLGVGAVTLTMLQYPVFGFVLPMGFGAGHLYAGDPSRGVWVGLGGYAATAGGGLAGYGLERLISGGGGALSGVTGLSVGAGLALVGYGVWAATDAYHTAELKALK